jgi:3-oxoacyl-[acyl-carrier protein] reductase
VAIQADSADPAAIQCSINMAADALGGFDILVNNAAIALQQERRVHRRGTWAPFWPSTSADPCSRPSTAIRRLQAGARIIHIGSAGADPIVGATHTVYCMTKSARQPFTRGLAQELGPRT